MTKEELKKLCVKFDCKKRAEETRWWELEQLKKLDLSTNSLTEIDSQIERLCDLEDLDVMSHYTHCTNIFNAFIILFFILTAPRKFSSDLTRVNG